MSKKDLKEKEVESPRGKQTLSAIETRIFDRVKKNDATLTGCKTKLLNVKDAVRFWTLLKDNTHVTSVQLAGTGLTDKCCKEASQALASNSTVTYLGMNDCSFGCDGFIDLSKGVFSNKSLKTFILGPPASVPGSVDRGIDELLLAIAEGGRLSRLSLLGFKLGNSIGRSLLKLMTRCPLRHLELPDNQLGDDAFVHIAAGLARSTTLKVLTLSGTVASAEGLHTLLKVLHKDNTTLVRLALNNTAIADTIRSVVDALDYPNGLRELELGACKIDSERAGLLFRSLAANRQLRRLHLPDNVIKDLSALQLDQSFNIVDLNLAGNLLGDEAVQRIAKQLPLARSLIRLNIARNPFDMGAAVKLFSPQLLMQSPLSQLNLSGGADDDSESGLSDVAASMLERRAKLAKDKAKVVDMGGWSKMQIPLQDCLIPRDPTAPAAGTELDLALLRLTDAHLAPMLAGISGASIQKLRLSGNALTQVPALEWQRLTHSLVTLDLSNNRITELPLIISVLSRLEHLDVRLNLLATVPKEVCQLPTLKSLLISHNRITLEALPELLLDRRDLQLQLHNNPLPAACIQEIRGVSSGSAAPLSSSASAASAGAYSRSRPFSADAERELIDMMISPNASGKFDLLRVVIEAVNTNEEGESGSEAVLAALLRLLDHYDVAAVVFAEVLRYQLALADNPSTCLRRDGPDMWMFSHYLANVCMPFLERTVKPIVARLQDAGKLPIADGPAAAGEEVNPKETLTGLTSALFEAVQRNVEILPASVGSLVALVAEGIATRWSDKMPSKEKQQQMAVASTIFLRLITPCIISPVTYNLGKKISSKSITKNHLNFARHLQGVANGSKAEHSGMAMFAAGIFNKTLALQVASRDPHIDADSRLVVSFVRTHFMRIVDAVPTLRASVPACVLRILDRLQITTHAPLVHSASLGNSIVSALSDSVRSLSSASSSSSQRLPGAPVPISRQGLQSGSNASSPAIRVRASIGSADEVKDKREKDKLHEDSSGSTPPFQHS